MKKLKLRRIKRRLKRLRLGENEKLIITLIGAGVLVAASLALPGLPIALKPFLKRNGPGALQKAIQRLRKKGVINLGGEEIKLTKKGFELRKKILVEGIKIQKPEEWDETWRLVSYDIPNNVKKDRDWFRQKLVNIGFKKIQESLWVHPYECKEEIAVLAQSLRVEPYVIFMTTEYLPQQKELEESFNLN